MRIAVLTDGASIAKWQADAIEQLGPGHSFQVYNCVNPLPRRRQLVHFPYYALNLISLRSGLTRRIPLPAALGDRIDFECRHEGAWESLPDELIGSIVASRPDAIVKFGMGLLKVPQAVRLPIPILSYHHGDPRAFRGRPAGLYEILSGAEVVGQIVQQLSNRLDAGRVLAFAETRVHRHSYRATMREAYAASRFLLGQALAAVHDGRSLDIVPEGRAYRLPSPWLVAKFAVRQAITKARRLAYGAFIEKQWQVARAPLPPEANPPFRDFPGSADWREIERPRGYRFLADPFPLPDGEGLLVEALRSSTGLGEILALGSGGNRTLLGGSQHFSYPSIVTTDQGSWLLPEVSEWSHPRLYALDPAGVREVAPLDIAGHYRLVDPTLLEWDSRTWLFANHLPEGDGILRLWTAASLHDRFEEHPASPILISPRGGRMGGAFITAKGSLYRVGQDGSGRYGNGVLFFEVEEISASRYRERLIGTLRFDHCRGPHTINTAMNGVFFDYYRERFAPLAGLRRLRARLARH